MSQPPIELAWRVRSRALRWGGGAGSGLPCRGGHDANDRCDRSRGSGARGRRGGAAAGAGRGRRRARGVRGARPARAGWRAPLLQADHRPGPRRIAGEVPRQRGGALGARPVRAGALDRGRAGWRRRAACRVHDRDRPQRRQQRRRVPPEDRNRNREPPPGRLRPARPRGVAILDDVSARDRPRGAGDAGGRPGNPPARDRRDPAHPRGAHRPRHRIRRRVSRSVWRP